MAGDQRVYSDEEFALILRKAAELSEPSDARSHPPGGLTLAEMKAAAAQAGFDPALVERAARLLRSNATAAPSFVERLVGGRPRLAGEAHFPIVLDEATADLGEGGTLAGEIAPGLEAVGALSGAGAALALARSYWALSTRTARERLSRVLDSVNRFLTPGNPTFVGAVGKPVETAGTEDELHRVE